MFARFDENPAMTLQDIKETKRYGRTHTRTHGQSLRGYNYNFRIIRYCYLIDCCSNIIYYFDIKFKTCFADILMFIFAKSQ